MLKKLYRKSHCFDKVTESSSKFASCNRAACEGVLRPAPNRCADWGKRVEQRLGYYFKDIRQKVKLCLPTKTTANRSSNSPGSGMGSFKGMLCPLKSVCWSILPAFPMFQGGVATSVAFSSRLPLQKITKSRLNQKGIRYWKEKCLILLLYPNLITSHRLTVGASTKRRLNQRQEFSSSIITFGGNSAATSVNAQWNQKRVLSVSCTISAPLPVSCYGDDVHDSG